MASHKGWYTRDLPHFDAPNQLQGKTFRLHDSLPKQVVRLLIRHAEEDNLRRELRKKREDFLNAGYGECWLKQPEIAIIVQNALKYFHSQRYDLISWCIMPNHVHVLIKTHQGFSLPDIIKSWKTYTARKANTNLGREGQFWATSYFDRYIRDEKHYVASIDYIHNNPVKAGLVHDAQSWPYSSSREWWPSLTDYHPT